MFAMFAVYARGREKEREVIFQILTITNGRKSLWQQKL